MIHRALTVPLSEYNLNKEINTIKHIAKINNIRIDVDKVIKKKLHTDSLKRTSSLLAINPIQDNTRWLKVPFIGNSSYKISRVLRHIGYRPAFYTLYSLRRLSQLKDPTPIMMKSGVYRLSCGECRTIYIGQTGRALLTRVKEHDSAWKARLKFLNTPNATEDRYYTGKNSAFADHLTDSGHTYNSDKHVELLHECNKSRTLDMLEEIEIILHNNNRNVKLVNDVQYIYPNLLTRMYTHSPDS